MQSLNGLDRLLEAEAKAAALIQEAEAKAAAIVGAAREEARSRESEELGRVHAGQASAYAEARAEAARTLRVELEDFGKRLASAPRDQASLAAACEGYLSPRS